ILWRIRVPGGPAEPECRRLGGWLRQGMGCPNIQASPRKRRTGNRSARLARGSHPWQQIIAVAAASGMPLGHEQIPKWTFVLGRSGEEAPPHVAGFCRVIVARQE